MSCDLFTAHVLYAMLKTFFFYMKITVSGRIIQMFQLLGEDYCYEEFYTENSFWVTCKKPLIDAFVFDTFL